MKHNEKILESFLEYLKTKKIPEKIEVLRNRKNELNDSQEASSNDIKNDKKEFESAKRHFKGMVKKDVRFKLIEHIFLWKKYQTLSKNWKITLNEKPKEKIKSRYVDKNYP